MLFVLLELGADRYVIDAAQVVEVLPLVQLKRIPGMPQGVAGAFNYRGTPVPVIDFSELTLGRPAQRRMSTRLILLRCLDEHGARRLLGLIADRATDTLRREPSDFVSVGIRSDQSSYLGPVATDASGLIQRIEVDALLPSGVRAALFASPSAA